MATEDKYQALFNLLVTATGVKTSSRRFKMWDDIDNADKPHLCTMQKGENVPFKPRMVNVYEPEIDVYLYFSTNGNLDAVLATEINNIIDTIKDAMKPAKGEDLQTLGGLVEYAAISGKIEIFEGVLGDQAVAIIPIKMKWTETSN